MRVCHSGAKAGRRSVVEVDDGRAFSNVPRDRHPKLMAAIARASSDRIVWIEKATPLPRRRLPVTKLAAEARGIRTAAGLSPKLLWQSTVIDRWLPQQSRARSYNSPFGGLAGEVSS